MVQVVFSKGEQTCQSGKLWQWDYGQVLQIIGLDLSRAEVHFCNDNQSSAWTVPAQVTESGVIHAEIPNKLLESGAGIRAYVYVSDDSSGETVQYMYLNVRPRPRPDTYDPPKDKTIWDEIVEKLNTKADDLQLEDGYIQLLSGNEPVGTRVRLPSGGGREIELRNNGTAIQWRYTDSNEWTDLIRLDALKGDPGETPEFEIRDGQLYAIYQE